MTRIDIPAGTTQTLTATVHAPTSGDYVVHAQVHTLDGSTPPALTVSVSV
jgi:hypothetical protein